MTTSAGLRARALWPVLHALTDRTPRSRLGIDPAGLEDPSRWVNLRVADRLWGLAGPRTALALGSRIEPGTFGHLTYLLAAAPTVGESLRCLHHYSGLLSHGARYRFERGAVRARIEVSLVEAPQRPVASELFLVAAVTCFLRRHTDGWCAQEIRLRQPAPACHELARPIAPSMRASGSSPVLAPEVSSSGGEPELSSSVDAGVPSSSASSSAPSSTVSSPIGHPAAIAATKSSPSQDHVDVFMP